MALYKPPALDKAAPIVDRDGRITPYFQRFWQNLSFTAGEAAEGSASAAADIAQINTDVTALTLVVAGKAPLASPAFTGNPTAPTPAPGDNDTSIATTAFVTTHAVARTTFNTWTAATGTAERTTFATYTAPVISAGYVQAEVQALADHVQILSRRLKALIDDLKT